MKVLTMFVLAVICAAGPACKGGGTTGGSQTERLAKAIEEARPMYDALAAIRAAVPAPAAMQARACPIEEMKSAAGNRPFLLKLTWNDLVETTGEDGLRTDADAKLGVFGQLTESRFSTLNGPRPELWKYPNPGLLGEAFERFRTYKFAAIVYPTQVKEPLVGGNVFTPGSAEAWVLIFRLEDAALLCADRMRAENDDSISYNVRTVGDMTAAQQSSVRENLKKHVDAAVAELIKTMTGGMR